MLISNLKWQTGKLVQPFNGKDNERVLLSLTFAPTLFGGHTVTDCC